jgi:hypothetical protein
MKPVLVLSLLICASPALAQSGDRSARGIPQEQALQSCTSQVEQQNLQTDEQKKQWMMSCLTDVTGTGPTARAAPAEEHAKVCQEQSEYLKLQGGEAENFVKACNARNERLMQDPTPR